MKSPIVVRCEQAVVRALCTISLLAIALGTLTLGHAERAEVLIPMDASWRFRRAD